MFQAWSRPKYFLAALARPPPDRCDHCWTNALLQDWAKSVVNGVPAGSDSLLSLWKVVPPTVYASGQDTPDDAVSTPELISAVDVITFMVEPGDTLAVSAKSLKPSLLAMARTLPVDGWMATIELLACALTADRAADSARESIVVARLEMLFGAMMAAWLFGMAVPLAFWIST
jgi:hypothetical protein